MLFRARPVAPPLDQFVESLWAYSDTPSHSKERIVPSGTVEMVINLHDDEIRICDTARPGVCRRYRGAIVSGPYESYFLIDATQQTSLVGVHFRPGGASPVLGVPAGELTGLHVDLADLWGPAAAELRERLCEAFTTEDRLGLLEAALRSHAMRPPAPHRAVAAGLLTLEGAAESRPRVRDIAHDVGLSQRRFIGVFAAAVGLRPKLFARVRRFQRATARLQAVRKPDWPSLAVSCGYFDQSHLIRDFLAFSGFTPTEFLRHQSGQVKEHHLPVGDEGQLRPIRPAVSSVG